MAIMKTRIWNGHQMQYSNMRWEDSVPMACTNHRDSKDRLMYENDIVKYQKYIAIIKKGQYKYQGRLQYGWYLECYYQGNKSIKPFYIDNIKEYKVISNIFENKNLYQQLKSNNWSRVISLVG